MSDPLQVASSAAPSQPAERFDQLYLARPPWEIGRAQPVFHQLAEAGRIGGRVLDSGCGTGEHVLLAAEMGLDATGIDIAPHAIATAQDKAAARGIAARFVVGDVLRLAELGERFDTILDSGVFHVFGDEDRARYVKALRASLNAGGTYLMCCFSDRQPGDWGPRRVTQDEIRAAFGTGWEVASIEATEFVTNLDPPAVQAWLAIITRC